MREAINYIKQKPVKQVKCRGNFIAKQYADHCIVINRMRFYGYTMRDAIRKYKDGMGKVLLNKKNNG